MYGEKCGRTGLSVTVGNILVLIVCKSFKIIFDTIDN